MLESGVAVWNCLNYIEANPVRAHMVADPGQYRFCSFGRWTGSGTHPFEEAINKHLLPTLHDSLGIDTMSDLRRQMRKRFAWITALEQQHRSPQEAERAMADHSRTFVARGCRAPSIQGDRAIAAET